VGTAAVSEHDIVTGLHDMTGTARESVLAPIIPNFKVVPL
jgi:hypothetical protein